MELFGYTLSQILTSQFLYFLIIFCIGMVLLHIATSILDFKKRSLKRAIVVLIGGCILAFVLSFVPYIGGILGLIGFWYMIKRVYDVGWVRSILAWLMSIVVAFFIAFVLFFFLGISLFFIISL